ncbi:helix-turn-helix domain-containing protein [Candidatus Uabimicrobium amorphum]|uniref:HTH cro/C1-type domain-containing protein n=1 Tax=Uabimicrobium amorphum TaxID=2596890 RepID=A0A5S9ITU0_UABAM|nr:helix-turn-helix domain-containing protein [Candidatus Uabimicrobium amorphum]BBM87292.1 hypothetical protein UABAM_05695 [Candidatus Uabimicrobium amorphum]
MAVNYQEIEINIGKAIKKGLDKNNLTRKAFAKVMGKSLSLVSEWTRNVKTPSGRDIIKIAIYLDIVEDLFPGYVKKDEFKVAESRTPYNKKINIEERVATLEKKIEKLEQYLN